MLWDRAELEKLNIHEIKKTNLFFRLVEIFLLSLFYGTKMASRILSPELITRFYDLVGKVIFYLRPGSSKRLIQKLTDALPEKDPQEIRKIALKLNGTFLSGIVDLVLLWRHTDRYMSQLSIEGLENLREADARGKGVLLITTHLGPFAVLHAVLARLGYPYTPIMWHPNATPAPRYVIALGLLAKEVGCDPQYPIFWAGEPTIDTVKEVRDHLERGKRVGLTVDVPGKRIVEFFGRPAALADGTAHWAIDTGAAIIPFYHLWGKEVFDRKLVFEEPLRYELTGDRKADVLAIMQQVAEAAERQIRVAPEQWFSWFGLWTWWEKAREIMEKEGS